MIPLEIFKENRGRWKLKEEATRSHSVENWLWKRLWTCCEILRHASPRQYLEINRSVHNSVEKYCVEAAQHHAF